MNYYERLGVHPEASKADIRAAYRKLSSEFHPDKNPDVDTKAEFQAIQEAYECLSDPEKREAYDLAGCPEDSEEARMFDAAMARVIQAFTSMMSQRISPKTNYRKGVIDKLLAESRMCESHIKIIEKKRENAMATLATFPVVPGNQVIRDSIQDMIDNASFMIAGQRSEIELLNKALEIAREVVQKPLNQQPQMQPFVNRPTFVDFGI